MSFRIEPAMFRSSAAACCGVLILLLLPVAILPGDDSPDLPKPERVVKFVRKDRIPPDAAEQINAGYYEDLFDFSSRTIATNRLITGKWATNWSRYEALRTNPTDRFVEGFLYYEMQPNVNVKEFGGTLVTNAHGMADREYTVARPDGIRRLTIIGDSISRGLGATHGKTFEALLEEKLNGIEPGRYEILNFAVGGYRITQLLWVLEHKVVEFQPQVHMVVFTDLTVVGKWADHIVQLVHDGRDLHYPYLKALVEKAGLRPDDDPQTFTAKLEPYHDEVITWGLDSMRAAARAQNASLIVLLVPTVADPDRQVRIASVRNLIRQMNIPLVDVTDTFVGISDLRPYRISRYNSHPTNAGHALLADRIFEKLRQNDAAWKLVTDGR